MRSPLQSGTLRRLLTVLPLLLVAFPALAQRPPRRPLPARNGRPPQRRPQTERTRKRPTDRQPDRLRVGDPAPNFTLKSPDGKRQVTLSDYRGKQPVALVFGSYT